MNIHSKQYVHPHGRDGVCDFMIYHQQGVHGILSMQTPRSGITSVQPTDPPFHDHVKQTCHPHMHVTCDACRMYWIRVLWPVPMRACSYYQFSLSSSLTLSVHIMHNTLGLVSVFRDVLDV